MITPVSKTIISSKSSGIHMCNPVEDNSLKMDGSQRIYYSKPGNEKKEEAIKRVIDEIIEHMFEKSPVVRIEERQSNR